MKQMLAAIFTLTVINLVMVLIPLIPGFGTSSLAQLILIPMANLASRAIAIILIMLAVLPHEFWQLRSVINQNTVYLYLFVVLIFIFIGVVLLLQAAFQGLL